MSTKRRARLQREQLERLIPPSATSTPVAPDCESASSVPRLPEILFSPSSGDGRGLEPAPHPDNDFDPTDDAPPTETALVANGLYPGTPDPSEEGFVPAMDGLPGVHFDPQSAADSLLDDRAKASAEEAAGAERSDPCTVVLTDGFNEATAIQAREELLSALDHAAAGGTITLDVGSFHGDFGLAARLCAGLLAHAARAELGVRLVPADGVNTLPWSLFADEWAVDGTGDPESCRGPMEMSHG